MVTKFNIERANTLPNGAEILSRKPADNDTGRWIVLCYYGGAQPYVNWYVDKKNGEAYWGSYHLTFEEAHKNYEKKN